MSIFGRRFPFIGKKGRPARSLPTVKFDASRVTQDVQDDLKATIRALSDIGEEHFQAVYDAALESIKRGRDLGMLCRAISDLKLPGMTKARAADIARLLNNRATTLMTTQRQLDAGITRARWLYSGAPCFSNGAGATQADLRQDAAHKSASGKDYQVDRGLLVGGKRIYPGSEPGCKCVSLPVILGFD